MSDSHQNDWGQRQELQWVINLLDVEFPICARYWPVSIIRRTVVERQQVIDQRILRRASLGCEHSLQDKYLRFDDSIGCTECDNAT